MYLCLIYIPQSGLGFEAMVLVFLLLVQASDLPPTCLESILLVVRLNRTTACTPSIFPTPTTELFMGASRLFASDFAIIRRPLSALNTGDFA